MRFSRGPWRGPALHGLSPQRMMHFLCCAAKSRAARFVRRRKSLSACRARQKGIEVRESVSIFADFPKRRHSAGQGRRQPGKGSARRYRKRAKSVISHPARPRPELPRRSTKRTQAPLGIRLNGRNCIRFWPGARSLRCSRRKSRSNPV